MKDTKVKEDNPEPWQEVWNFFVENLAIVLTILGIAVAFFFLRRSEWGKKITTLKWWKEKYNQIKNWWKEQNLFGEKIPLILAGISLFSLLSYFIYAVLEIFLCLDLEKFFCTEKNIFDTIGSGAMRNLSWMLGGSVGWFFLYRRTKIADRNTKATEQNTKIAQRHAKIAEQGLVAERFTRAMEQIASENPSIRMGGFLGLEQIAKSQQEDHRKIARILSARIREIATKERQKVKDAESIKNQSIERNERKDIEVAVNALARIASKFEIFEKHSLCDLRNTDLHDLQFEGANLSGFDLRNANLRDAELEKADLSDAWLDAANLRNAFLSKTKLKDADLNRANLQDVNNLTQRQLNQAYYWQEFSPPKNLPKGLKPPPERDLPKEVEDEDESSGGDKE